MSRRRINVAAVQPSVSSNAEENEAMISSAWELSRRAADQGAQLIVMPEYFNVMGLERDALIRRSQETEAVRARAADFCRQTKAWVLLPMIEQRSDGRFNTAHLFDSSGEIVFTYDKTHLTVTERRDYALIAGSAIDVVETRLGCIGVMICYDVYFPEVARVLSLRGAQIILFPSLQRSDTREGCMLINRARAMDNTCYLVRSSYGLKRGEVHRSGMVYGASCIVAPNGIVLADAGYFEGVAFATVDLGWPWKRPRASGMGPQVVRDFLTEDRRPELYGLIAAGT